MFSERIAPCKSFKLDENLEQFRLEIGLTLLLLQFDAANGFTELDQKQKVFFFSSYWTHVLLIPTKEEKNVKNFWICIRRQLLVIARDNTECASSRTVKKTSLKKAILCRRIIGTTSPLFFCHFKFKKLKL